MDVSAFWGGFACGLLALGGTALFFFMADLMTNHRCPYTTNWGREQCVLPRNHLETEHQQRRY